MIGYDLLKCKSKYKYLVNELNEPINIVSNLGLKKYNKAYVSKKGEYYNFCIEAQEDIPSILTNHHIGKAIELINKNRINIAAMTINMNDYYKKYGDTIIYYVIDKWMVINKFSKIYEDKYSYDLINNIALDDKDKIDKYVLTERHHQINGKIKIVNIGVNTKTKMPVVPEEWMNRIYNNGYELHKKMDELPSRKGKPLVHYCCIYSMTIKIEDIWTESVTLDKGTVLYDISFMNTNIYTNIINICEKQLIHSKDKLLLMLDNNICIKVDANIICNDNIHIKTESVGYLSSLLQKCIRRGIDNRSLLKETLNKLNNSPSYNLPDHNFALVSGTRQMIWRSYISIMEDVRGYAVNYDDIRKCEINNVIDMLSMAILSIVCQLDPKIKLSNNVVTVITNTMLIMQSYNKMWNWRNYDSIDDNFIMSTMNYINDNINKNILILHSIKLSIGNIPMMKNDNIMLRKIFNYVVNNKINNIKNIITNYYIHTIDYHENMNIQWDTKCAAMDMHCRPTILIDLQSMIDDVSVIYENNKNTIPTLSQLANFIWNNSSRNNYRHNCRHNDNQVIPEVDSKLLYSLKTLQEYLLGKRNIEYINWYYTKRRSVGIVREILHSNKSYYIGRIAWLLIFGKTYKIKYKSKMYDVILAGDSLENICKVKKNNNRTSEYINDGLRGEIQEYFLDNFNEFNKNRIKLPSPPNGFVWNFCSDGKTTINVYYKNNTFYIDDIQVVPLNLINQISLIGGIIEEPEDEIADDLILMIKKCTFNTNDHTLNNISNIKLHMDDPLLFKMLLAGELRREVGDHRIFKWYTYVCNHNKYGLEFRSKMWRIILARIYTSDTDIINGKFILSVGPCDRHGKKTNNSISYTFEGIIYRIFCMLEMLYPFLMIHKGKNTHRWIIDKKLPEYLHMIDSINSIIASDNTCYYSDQVIKINTHLWEHQSKSINKILSQMTINGRRGFGDASHVGAGKTLCALGLMAKLYDYNINNYIKSSVDRKYKYGSFIVLVPSIQLIKTWTDEIKKHTNGFDILIQKANGILEEIQNNIHDISTTLPKSNSIVITTMGRIRDHPIQHPWILVVIDECLSVQNKEALQTEEAWRQCCYSQYGVVMLSATFFRSRFDKMLYMIKMLKSGLPEKKEYLDAILSETIICNITDSERKWLITTTKHELTMNERNTYNSIHRNNINKGAEQIYIALSRFIQNNICYIDIFYNEIDNINDYVNCVIFAKSKEEANKIYNDSRNNGRIKRYPEKGQHTVLSLSEGTYGLNDLIIYNTIIMRPPEPDKLSQIKGRLDRPGQKSKKLYLKYILLKDTIEEAFLLRLEMCNNFYNNYIMPLSEYYNIAINIHDKINDKVNDKINDKVNDKVNNKIRKITKNDY